MGTSATSARCGERRSILVVDDNASIRTLVVQLFTELGFIVESAPDGATAIERAAGRAPQFDLVVTDVHMPGASGFELGDAVAVDATGPAVLFMSGTPSHDRRDAVPAAAVHAFIAKPFSASELLGAVDVLFAERDRRLADGQP